MGARSSMNTSMNIVSNVFTSSMVKVSKSCSQQTIASQNVSASNVGGDVTFENISQAASITINFECLQSSENQQAILNNVKESCSAALQSTMSGISANKASVDTKINAVTNAAMMTDMQNFASCAQSSWTIQNVSATNVAGNVTFKNISQSMIMNITGKCLQSNTALQDACAALDKTVGVEASVESIGVDPIGDFYRMIQNNMAVSVVGCVVCVIVCMACTFFLMKD